MAREIKTLDKAEIKRRSSIRYILRRRKRAASLGANSGAPIKAWARERAYTFTPSGNQSAVQMLGYGFLVFLALGGPFFLMGALGVSFEYGAPWWAIATYHLIVMLIVFATSVVLIICLYGLWRIVMSNFRKTGS
ncbi:MAG: hypothetical protein Hens3KO_16280 [Henriciella sp.]